MNTCPGIADNTFLESVLTSIDCQAQTLGAQGYQAMAAPGSSLSLLLGGMLTIFIALIGYRMILGETPSARDGVIAFVKVGIVFALAMSWAAYRTLAYDVVFHGPASLVSDIGAPAGLPGTSGGIVGRLGQVDRAIQELGRLGPGSAMMASRPQVDNGQASVVTQEVSDPPSIFSPYGLGTARIVYLTATIAAFAAVRLVAGLLLALGPLFIAFLLFDGTRSLFEGWMRGLLGAALGAIAVTILLSVELALLEPWLGSLILRRRGDLLIGGAATELLVVTLAFALTLVAGLGMAARFAMAFRLPLALRALPERLTNSLGEAASKSRPLPERTSSPAESHSRAAAVAEAVAQVERREARGRDNAVANQTAILQSALQPQRGNAAQPLGQQHRRRTRGRISASAGRRDQKP
ncbi:type IV secretion system protein [Sphingomonas sp. RS6]